MKFIAIVLFSVGCFQLTHAKLTLIKEGGQKLLSCDLQQVLDIHSADYGGRSIFCSDNDVTSIVQRQCQNKKTCMVYAKDEIYEDSCFGPEEVLSITYRCIDDITSTETTKSIAVSMTTRGYSTIWQPTGQNDSVTESGNQTNVSAGKPSTKTDETITIATLIAGCIFGLLLIGILTIAIFRRFREKRDGSDDVRVLQMSSLSQGMTNQEPVNNSINIQSNGCTQLPSKTNVRNMTTRYFGNNAYNLQSSSAIISESTTSKYVDASRHMRDGGEYTLIEQYPTDNLPPSYDSVSRNNLSAAVGHSINVYNHAHYSADDYAKSNTTGLLQEPDNVSDGYSKAAVLISESTHCSGKSDNVYENENVSCNQNGSFSKCKSHVEPDNLLPKNKTSNHSEKDKGKSDVISSVENNSLNNNQYDNIDIRTASKKSHYQNIEDEDLNIKGPSQYMPMEFGKGGSIDRMENVYVPIMSPSSPSDIFDDTYQF